VIITGTPGVGKTVHCEQLAQEAGLRHLSISQIVKERECHEGFDTELKSYIVDEDKVWRYLMDFRFSSILIRRPLLCIPILSS